MARTNGLESSWRMVTLAFLTVAVTAGPLALTATAAPTVLYVDKGNSSCTDSGTGTLGAPFCTLVKGAAVALAGQTVQVAAGTYAGSVDVAHSGSVGSPVTLSAAPGVVVTSTAIGISIASKAYVTVTGFETGPTTNEGIKISGTSSHILVSGNHVHNTGHPVSGQTEYGIGVRGSTADSTVSGNTVDHNSDSGIYVADTSTRILVTHNNAFANARGYTRAAPGIDIRSNGNTILANYSHDNEDSGVQLRGSCSSNVVAGNRTDHNGDHGIDILDCTGTFVTGNSVYLNVTAGINDEGQSQNATIRNNISVDNGINSPRTSGNIRVDSRSYVGSIVDSNLTYLSTASTDYVWNTTSYSSLAAFKTAVGQEAHGLQADPLWRNRAAGDFHLFSGSPAIDSADADATGEPTVDYDGVARNDDSTTANTGIGARTIDDRGAYEFTPNDSPPVAALTVTPVSGPAPLVVTADASGSTDSDASPIASYAFNFGDGTPAVGPQTGATATHSYAASGTFSTTVTVTDTAGLTATKSTNVTIDGPPVAALTVTPSSGSAPLAVSADASGSTDTDTTPIASYAFAFGDGSATVGPQSAATVNHTYTVAGSYTVRVTVKDTAGLSSTKTAFVTVPAAPDAAPVARLNVTPSTGPAPLTVTADASASTDTDATPIATYRFNFGDGSPVVGPQSSPTATHTYASVGTYTVTIEVSDTVPQASHANATVTVTDTAPTTTLTLTPSSGTAPLTVSADASGSTDNDGTGILTYSFDFGDGSTIVGPQAAATAAHTYTAAGTFTVTVTVKDTAGLTSTKTAAVTASADAAPVAALTVTPSSGHAPLAVTADASGSTDPDATPIASYAFSFGDGSAPVGPQAGATAHHTYPATGSFTVIVTVKDTAGLSAQRSVNVTVTGAVNAVGNPGFETDLSGWSGYTSGTLLRVANGHSGSWQGQVTNSATTTAGSGINDQPNWVTSTVAAPYTLSAWVRADTAGTIVTLRVREYNGTVQVSSATKQVTLSTTWQQVALTYSPAAAHILDVQVYEPSAPAAAVFFVDDISLSHT